MSANVAYSRYRYSPAQDTNSYSHGVDDEPLAARAASPARYALSWDIARGYILSQNVMASYMAQCCGLQVEFQKFNYPANAGFPIPSDRRFNVSFVLAGLGTFSNFFGAFGQR